MFRFQFLDEAEAAMNVFKEVFLQWKMENGEWKMENGKWKMENGEWTDIIYYVCCVLFSSTLYIRQKSPYDFSKLQSICKFQRWSDP